MSLKFWGKKSANKAKVEGVDIKSGVQVFNISNESFLAYALGGGTYVSASKALNWYRSNSAVATAVDLIAGAIEQINPVLKTEDGKFEDDHEVLELLRNPNDFDVWQDFIGTVARNYLLKHDAFITAHGSLRTRPVELWPEKLQNISVVQAADTYPLSFNITQGMSVGNYIRQKVPRLGTRFVDARLKELLHIKGFSSRPVELDGDSPLQAAATETKQVIEGRTHNLKLIQNGGYLSLVMAFKDEGGIDDDEHKKRVEAVNEQLGGSDNAGKIVVMSQADISELKELGQTNKDMNFKELDETAALAIYSRYHIPLPLISMKAATFRNMETALQLFYDMAVLPNADVVLSALSRFLLPRYGLDPAKVQITYNPESINVLRVRQLEELEKRKGIAIETTNELRKRLGLELIEGGDIFYQPATLVPAGEEVEPDDNNTDDDLEGAGV